jgi:hypothetical protein
MTAAAIIAKAIGDIREAVAAGDFSCRCCLADGDASIRVLLAAYDSLADGSAVRQARAREADALRRAGDAEAESAAASADRCDLREQLNETGTQRDNAREDLASLLDDAAAVVRAMEEGDRAMDGRLFDDDARDLDGVIRAMRDNGREGWWRTKGAPAVPHAAATERVKQRLATASPAEIKRSFVAAGIIDESGALTERYGGGGPYMVPSQAKVVAKIIAADERERDEAVRRVRAEVEGRRPAAVITLTASTLHHLLAAIDAGKGDSDVRR